MSILDFWSHQTSPPRKIQEQALEWLESQTAKYLIVEAPVGSGKSHIGMSYSRFLAPDLGNSFILTPQRILQEQYANTFKTHGLVSLYGKSNYPCRGKNTTCDIGCIVKPKCHSCPQVSARKAAQIAPNVVFNYKIAMLHFAYLTTFKPRNLMILDECHNTEEMLCEFDAITISEYKTKRYKINWKRCTTINEAQKWVKETYLPQLDTILQNLKSDCEELMERAEHTTLGPVQEKQIREYLSLHEHFDNVSELIHTKTELLNRYYVLIHSPSLMKFKRMTAAFSFNNIMGPKAERFLFMSSTVLNHKGFCRDLGISSKEAAFISLDSEFPIKNRPVYFSSQTKMNAKWNTDDNKQGREKVLDTVIKLLTVHKDQSGIIHTGNFAIAVWLTKNLKQKTHNIMHHNPDSGDDRNKVINAFMNSKKPTILISPSITEGLDLYDDRSRFAIFCKIPFGYLGDQWIKARLNLSQEWYQRQAVIQVIQGGGRIVRSKNDWGNVYILDSSWGYLFTQTVHMVPSWWKDSYGKL